MIGRDIWTSKYVCRLGIMDHIREISSIDDQIIRTKNRRLDPDDFKSDLKALNESFEKECADLFVILGRCLDAELIQERREKFSEKAREEEESDRKWTVPAIPHRRRKYDFKKISAGDLLTKVNAMKDKLENEDELITMAQLFEMAGVDPESPAVDLPKEIIETIRNYRG